MADKEAENPAEGGPSLEMPSFGFGRKRGKRGTSAEEPPREEAAAAEAAPVPPHDEPAQAEPEQTEPEPVAQVEETQQLDPVAHEPQPEAEHEPDLAHEPAPEPKRKAKRTPALGGMTAAIVTGAFIGLLQVGLTWGSLHLCELVRGTSACGKPGFLVLLAIMVVLIVAGALLLKVWGVADPGATSFLGVGLVAVLLLLFLVKLLFNWWMVIVVPVLGMIAFALAYWLSTAFVEQD